MTGDRQSTVHECPDVVKQCLMLASIHTSLLEGLNSVRKSNVDGVGPIARLPASRSTTYYATKRVSCAIGLIEVQYCTDFFRSMIGVIKARRVDTLSAKIYSGRLSHRFVSDKLVRLVRVISS